MKSTVLLLILTVFLINKTFAQEIPVISKKIVYKKLGNQELNAYMFYTEESQKKGDNTAIALFHALHYRRAGSASRAVPTSVPLPAMSGTNRFRISRLCQRPCEPRHTSHGAPRGSPLN